MIDYLVTPSDFLNLVPSHFGRCLFRGCNSSKHELLPSIGRSHHKLKFDVSTEKKLLDQFKLIAGKSIPPGTSDLGRLVLGRHYGLRTRLLDWTANPYVALYFALLGFDPSRCYPPCVYVAKSPRIEQFSALEQRSPWDCSDDVVFFEPPHLDGRITSQKAFLSLHGNPYQELQMPTLERYYLMPSTEEFEKLEQTLLAVGISHSLIYPGLDGVCREINDSPDGILSQLNVDRNSFSMWKPVPYAWASRPWPLVRERLMKQRLLSEFLAFKADATAVGTPVELNRKSVGVLLSYDSDSVVRTFVASKNKTLEFPLADGSADELRVSESTIKKYFPSGDVTFITKRPTREENLKGPQSQSSLYGCMYYTLPATAPKTGQPKSTR